MGGALIFLCFNLNSKNTFNNYKDPIWSDAAGYYVYLPATFIYGWESNSLPEDWPESLGNGFHYDEEGKLQTKYPVGVAIMELPFFLGSHAVASIRGNGNGYSMEYHVGLWLAGVFYLLFGLIYLKKYLSKRYELKYVLISLFVILLCTNLYYYGLNSTGMSHVYSFFLFSVMLWLGDRLENHPGLKYVLAFAFFAALALVVRPTHAIFLAFVFILHPGIIGYTLQLIRKRWWSLLILFLVVFLPLLPQLLYWKYQSDSWFHYSYTGETFNWFSPELIKIWFSSKNGLFPYTPIWLFILFGVVFWWKHARKKVLLFAGFFILISFVFSAWWCWWYGCSYGSRPFVEYLAPFSIPFCLFVQQTFQAKTASWKYLFVAVVALFAFVNLKIIYKYDDCFHGGLWDWEAFYKLIF